MSESIPRHLEFPRLRSVEAIPVSVNGETLIALRDVSQLTDQMVAVTLAAVSIAEQFTGATSITSLASALNIDATQLRPMVSQLDEAGLLEGPTFDSRFKRIRSEFDALQSIPIRAAADVSAERMAGALDRCEAPSETANVVGLVAPHLDFNRGQHNYATAYRALAHLPAPDRVVVLGTNHFGRGTGVVMCDKGFETTVGPLRLDHELSERMRAALGASLTEHRLDHAREHSVELQMPWVRQVIGDVPVVGFLVHDPLRNGGESYDGRGVALDPFVEALRESLAALDGRTLIITSADLSHVGPQFGDAEPNSPTRLAEVEAHDRRHLEMLTAGELDRFLDSMGACGNSTNWCTLGGMAALWKLTPNGRAQLLRYEQAVDAPAHGVCCVTSAAMLIEDEVAA